MGGRRVRLTLAVFLLLAGLESNLQTRRADAADEVADPQLKEVLNLWSCPTFLATQVTRINSYWRRGHSRTVAVFGSTTWSNTRRRSKDAFGSPANRTGWSACGGAPFAPTPAGAGEGRVFVDGMFVPLMSSNNKVVPAQINPRHDISVCR